MSGKIFVDISRANFEISCISWALIVYIRIQKTNMKLGSYFCCRKASKFENIISNFDINSDKKGNIGPGLSGTVIFFFMKGLAIDICFKIFNHVKYRYINH